MVTPSAESVGAKAIRVTQAGKVLPPSLSVNEEELADGFKYSASGAKYTGPNNIRVTAVNTDWNARAVDAEGNAVTWFSVKTNKENKIQSIGVDVTKNETYEERVGYVLITATVEGVPEIRVSVTQDAASEHLSTLTEDVDVSGMTHAYVGVYPNQSWHPEDKASGWNITVTTENLTTTGPMGTVYSGSGVALCLSMGSEHMPFNDDQEYWMADGIYTVVKREAETGEIPEQQMTVGSGYAGYWPGQRMSSWVMCIEEGEFVKGGPVAAGTVTVTRDGDNYTFVVELADDFDFKITGVFTVLFDDIRQMDLPTDNYN